MSASDQSMETQLLKDIEMRESLDPNHYYDTKRYSITRLRDAGCPDAEIEYLLGITLKPEDRVS